MALIALVVIIFFILFNNNLSKDFSFSSNNLKKTANNITTNTNNVEKIKEPEKTCQKDICSIDFGHFILTDIPSNYDDYIAINGTSAGTKKLLNMLEQIANQLEKDKDIEGAKEYRELINLGHFLSNIEKKLEDSAKSCKNATNSIECFNDKVSISSEWNLKPPENVKHLIPEFSTKTLQFDSNDQILTIDYAVNQYHHSIKDFNDDKDLFITFAIADKFKSIINNDKYSIPMKNVTIELMTNISDLSRDISKMTHLSYKTENENKTSDYITTYDLVTGDNTGIKNYNIKNSGDIVDSHVSTITNITSSLVCTADSNNNTEETCHK